MSTKLSIQVSSVSRTAKLEVEFAFHEGEEENLFSADGEFVETETEEPWADKFYEEEDSSSFRASPQPLPVTENGPVSFARLSRTGGYWPVVTSHSKGRELAFMGTDKKTAGHPGRRFLATRTWDKRYHADL